MPDGVENEGRRRLPIGAVFPGVLLLAGCVYTLAAFRFEFVVAAGRPGPGFFPRLIGAALVTGCVYVLAVEARRPGPAEAGSHAGAALAFGLGGAVFVAGFVALGAWPAILAYLIATLVAMNRGRHASNIAIGVGVAIVFHVFFDVWLNVPLPAGPFRIWP